MEPVVAVVLAYLLFGEVLSPLGYFGALLVILAVLLAAAASTVDVPVPGIALSLPLPDDLPVTGSFGEYRVGARDDQPDRLGGVGAGSFKKVVRFANLQIVEEDLIQLIIVVLPGVHEDMVRMLFKGGYYA